MKRKVFLFGMAIMASMIAGSHAQEIRQAERDDVARSMGEYRASNSNAVDVIQEAPEMRVDGKEGGAVAAMLDEIKGMARKLGSRTEVVTEYGAGAAWNLGMLQADPARLGLSDDPKITATRPVGMSLRLKF